MEPLQQNRRLVGYWIQFKPPYEISDVTFGQNYLNNSNIEKGSEQSDLVDILKNDNNLQTIVPLFIVFSTYYL